MTKNQRIVVLTLLAGLLTVLFVFAPTAPSSRPEIRALLFSSLFLLSFTALLLEHFFARPTDVVAAGVSILLLMVPSRMLLAPWGVWYWLFGAYELLAVLSATVALLLLTEAEGPSSRRNRLSGVLKTLTTRLAPGRAQYFFLFLLSLIFFVEPRSIPFVAFLAYGLFVFLLEPSRVVVRLPALIRDDSPEVGEILSVQGRGTFLVRLHGGDGRPPLRVGDLLEFSYSMDEPRRIRRAVLLERFFLDQAQWVRALCHDDIDREAAELPYLENHRPDAVYKRADRNTEGFFGDLVGLVQDGTEIRTLRFLQAGRAPAEEGALVQVPLPTGPVLYQIVNAEVDTESLGSRNETDFVVGEALQLGQWSEAIGAFLPFGWVPAGRTPVFRAKDLPVPEASEDEIVLGTIPGTDFPVLLNRADAISHHTAILGVTGVGKSVFARKLVREFAKDDVRVIVVDFTREWQARMQDLGASPMIAEGDANELRQAINEIAIERSKYKNQQDPDYIEERKRRIFDGFKRVLDAFLQGDQHVRIFELPELSNTEGVLEYTQWFFRTLFRIARDSNCYEKRVCIVLEEAHTVIPEWNFIGLADRASQSLVNNISQIALQGRKYGVGFVVVAQRTATVSKTVLTQCNTVIAFQCFDDTSIGFLANYLPRSVAEALPNLRFRRAVAVGKAVRGSVPLMFDVPEINEGGIEVR